MCDSVTAWHSRATWCNGDIRDLLCGLSLSGLQDEKGEDLICMQSGPNGARGYLAEWPLARGHSGLQALLNQCGSDIRLMFRLMCEYFIFRLRMAVTGREHVTALTRTLFYLKVTDYVWKWPVSSHTSVCGCLLNRLANSELLFQVQKDLDGFFHKSFVFSCREG